MTTKKIDLKYIFLGSKRFPDSLDSLHSDLTNNAILQVQLVGTLLSYEKGAFTPYIAEKYEIRNNGLEYRFTIRENLYSQNGVHITAMLVKELFEKNILKYKSISKPPLFKYLKGFDSFYDEKVTQISGIKVSNNQVIFNFLKKPTGVLNYFVMPYYGLGLKDSNGKVDSTGSFLINDFSKGVIRLSLRDNWVLSEKSKVKSVEISNVTSLEEVSDDSQFTIIDLPRGYSSNIAKKRFMLHKTAPIISTTLSIGKNKIDNPFVGERLTAFKSFVNKFQNDNPILNDAKVTNSVFNEKLSSKGDFSFDDYTNVEKRVVKVLSAKRGSESEVGAWLKKLYTLIEEKFNVKIEFVKVDKTDPNWLQNINSNKYEDFRIERVHVGTRPYPWLVDLMFCSKFGISFPDKENEMCSLVKQSETLEMEKFEEEYFLREARNDYLIPLFKEPVMKLLSRELSELNFPRGETVVRFDLL
tara:strand:- start:143341 stop:144750 length:1410 start_codon:yes stop_codon:yes gene_type:complete